MFGDPVAVLVAVAETVLLWIQILSLCIKKEDRFRNREELKTEYTPGIKVLCAQNLKEMCRKAV
jgi:hypothetical protein